MGPVEELDMFDRNKSWMAVFQKIRTDSLNEHKFSLLDSKKTEFKSRNRYGDVSPYDHSRVILKQDNIDYINASLVKAEDANRAYILTQGPLPDTSGHFWLMVWEQESSAILMLNKIIEKDHIKCHKYFPSGENRYDQEMTFKDVGLKVKFIDELESNKDFVIRLFQLQKLKSKTAPNHLENHGDDEEKEKGKVKQTGVDEVGNNNNDDDEEDDTKNTRQILQFHYMSWPDFGVPDTPTDFLNFLYTVRKYAVLDDANHPPVIHCSAGIGRSGTFCLVDTCLVLAEKYGTLDNINVLGKLMEMRKYRMGLIQTHDQLRFSFIAIVKGASKLKLDDSCSEEDVEDEEDVDDERFETNGYEEDDEGEEELDDYEDDDDVEVAAKKQKVDVLQANSKKDEDDKNGDISKHLKKQQQQEQQQQQQQQPTLATNENDVTSNSVKEQQQKNINRIKTTSKHDEEDNANATTGSVDNNKTENRINFPTIDDDVNNEDGDDYYDEDQSNNSVNINDKSSSSQSVDQKKRMHDERVKRTKETLERMKRKQLEVETYSSSGSWSYLYGALSLVAVTTGILVYKYLNMNA